MLTNKIDWKLVLFRKKIKDVPSFDIVQLGSFPSPNHESPRNRVQAHLKIPNLDNAMKKREIPSTERNFAPMEDSEPR